MCKRVWSLRYWVGRYSSVWVETPLWLQILPWHGHNYIIFFTSFPYRWHTLESVDKNIHNTASKADDGDKRSNGHISWVFLIDVTALISKGIRRVFLFSILGYYYLGHWARIYFISVTFGRDFISHTLPWSIEDVNQHLKIK